MKFVFASDSFKGSLSSTQISSLLESEATAVFPNAECVCLPLADGGEGTVAAIASVRSGEFVPLYVFDALRRPIRRKLFISDNHAFIEAAETCGLGMLAESERNPFATTSNGVGAFISHALFHGCSHITVGLGGSSTNDGGMGCLRALGVRFLDKDGRELSGSGIDLERVAEIDESELYPQVRDVDITVLSDVTNPLLGPSGATHVFAGQKGADRGAIDRLEAGMRNFANVIARTHPDADFDTPGYGAAGGLGMALSVFLGAHIEPGIEAMLQLLEFDKSLEGADLVITGEGRLDAQSLDGKAVSGVVSHAHREGVPVAIICGQADLTDTQIQALDVAHIIQTGAGQSANVAMQNAEDNYRHAARELFDRLRG